MHRRQRRRFCRCKCVDRKSEIERHVAREARADNRDRESRVAQRELNAIGSSAEAGVILEALPRICPALTQGWLRMSPGCGCRGGRRCEQRFTSGLPKPITAPCGSLTQLATRSGTSAGTHPRFS